MPKANEPKPPKRRRGRPPKHVRTPTPPLEGTSTFQVQPTSETAGGATFDDPTNSLADLIGTPLVGSTAIPKKKKLVDPQTRVETLKDALATNVHHFFQTLATDIPRWQPQLAKGRVTGALQTQFATSLHSLLPTTGAVETPNEFESILKPRLFPLTYEEWHPDDLVHTASFLSWTGLVIELSFNNIGKSKRPWVRSVSSLIEAEAKKIDELIPDGGGQAYKSADESWMNRAFFTFASSRATLHGRSKEDLEKIQDSVKSILSESSSHDGFEGDYRYHQYGKLLEQHSLADPFTYLDLRFLRELPANPIQATDAIDATDKAQSSAPAQSSADPGPLG